MVVVDDDREQCAKAHFRSIQAAVAAAKPGGLVRVCPGNYAESVTVDKALKLKGKVAAAGAVDCFDPMPAQLADADPSRHVIVDPPGAGFSVGFRLAANNITLAGFVLQGASVGIDASDRFSGYRIRHNLIRLNTLFGVDFGSVGARRSRVDHNCIRENRFGLVSELDDDSLWAFPVVGDERGAWNARDLRNARIDHNSTFRNMAGVEAAGPGRRERVTFDNNVSREDGAGVLIQNSTESAIFENEVTGSRGNAIVIGGGNDRLLITANRVQDASGSGIVFVQTFIDRFPIASRGVVVTENEVRRAAAGMLLSANNLVGSLIAENTTGENRGNGIVLLTGNSGNVFRGNHSNNNGVNGIVALLGATGNRFEQNSMHGNANFDARDLNRPLNEWISNDCEKDDPPGAICGIG